MGYNREAKRKSLEEKKQNVAMAIGLVERVISLVEKVTNLAERGRDLAERGRDHEGGKGINLEERESNHRAAEPGYRLEGHG